MTAERAEETVNDGAITESDRLERIEAMVTALHDEWMRLRPLIDALTSNPAARWKARRSGGEKL